MNNNDKDLEVLSETENFTVWRSEDSEGTLYHLELGAISLHLLSEEWDELVSLIRGVD